VSIKRILVHADATPEGLQRARTARRIADEHEADVEALVISALPAEAYGPGAEAIRDAVLNQRKQVEAELARTSEAVAREVSASVHSFCTRIDRMRIDAAMAMRSADLVVVGPPLHDGFLHHDDVFHAALFLSGRPCLVLPYIAQPYEGGTSLFGPRILIAWKDCREAARAVHDAMPFLERAGAIAVVAIMPEDDSRFFGQRALDRLASALRTRGLPVEAVHARPARGGVHHALLREAEEFRADTIVMGGYGRPRISEFVFGGMTHSMLTRMHCPILMSH
jgi:nucleotide-binding universal stress UspA family protein